ncbi:MAG: RNA pseudouridine synthase [Phaeodactylibacter sp.]|nr:RNA pseudouridine synthase [Phaeodactylibacter sp.]MCB9288979.1 RNA pseudouridine synthase [Lewinellaceae bacterium]
MKISIIQETPGWLAVNKPAGIQVERNPFGPSVESLAYAHLELKRRNPYVGIVHRLDRVTTGVVLVAKNKSTLRKLNEQFRLKEVQKTYLAMVERAPSEEEATVTHWLEKDLNAKRAKVVGKGSAKAFECRLSYRQLWKRTEGWALLEIHPVTGKYHQIRAQLAAIGCPVVGDIHYGASEEYQPSHIMLHAWKLAFPAPGSEERLEVEAPLPEWAEVGF